MLPIGDSHLSTEMYIPGQYQGTMSTSTNSVCSLRTLQTSACGIAAYPSCGPLPKAERCPFGE
jgi:hypothetical protein